MKFASVYYQYHEVVQSNVGLKIASTCLYYKSFIPLCGTLFIIIITGIIYREGLYEMYAKVMCKPNFERVINNGDKV